MKKLLLFILASTLSLAAISQTTAEQIIAKFDSATGMNKIDLKDPDQSMLIDLTITTQGMTMPMQMTSKGTDKFRIEMEAMGQKMVIIRDGDKGWMSMGGQVQPMPKEALIQQAEQTNVLKTLKLDKENYDMEYVGSEGNMEIVKVKSKDKNDNAGTQTLYFDKNTCYLTKVKFNTQGADVEVAMSDYKDFNGVKIPSLIDTKMGEQSAAKVQINNVEFDYPTAAWMFAEPKK